MNNDISKLLIKNFIFEGKYYLYDTFTNTLFQIEKEHYIAIEKFKKNGFPKIEVGTTLSSYEKDILMLKKRGLFASDIVDEIRNPFLEYVESLLCGAVNDMTLQVTRMCNFDCRYCLYAGEEGIEREHEEKHMSLDTAYRSIDFLYNHSYDANKIIISFYGGEPLLNFELIEKVVAYVRERFFSKTVEFSMTINGSLLSKENIDFLVEHRFKLAISLDGPEEIQNKHRKFRNTGRGTFETVMSNVLYLQKNYPEYFYKYVTFMPVVIDDEDYKIVTSFFENSDIPASNITPLKANLDGVDYYLSSANNIFNSSGKHIEKASEGINDDAERSLREMYNRKESISRTWHHNGQCIPGIQRIFVDCSGKLYPCEKIVENDALVIGSLETGFNISKIKELLSIGLLSKDRCKKCWAMRFCEICASLCLNVDSNELCSLTKEHACKAQEDNAMWIFKKIIKEGY